MLCLTLAVASPADIREAEEDADELQSQVTSHRRTGYEKTYIRHPLMFSDVLAPTNGKEVSSKSQQETFWSPYGHTYDFRK